MAKAILVQYKFVLPSGTKHASYAYQKLFRALYGYTQNVSKSSGKTYRYHRQGILTAQPHTKPGKNAVLIPKSALPGLVDFFKTGKNPSHEWHVKGDWKAVYYTDERDLSPAETAAAVEAAAGRVLSSLGIAANLAQSPITEPAVLGEGQQAAARAALAKLMACEWANDCQQTPKIQRLTDLTTKQR